MGFIHELESWPDFIWDTHALIDPLSKVVFKQGKLLGRMGDLGFDLQTEATLLNMTSEVLRSCEIEGELLDAAQVRSSVARHLGMDIGTLLQTDKFVEGIVEVMLDATRNAELPLSKERLFDWHSALFPTGRKGMHRITVGRWRDTPMDVISGPYGREKIHFSAPAADKLEAEMERFLAWFNAPPDMHPIWKAAVAHLWFVTIHPFEDGNGRLARAIADRQLAKADGTPQRFYSMSSQIKREHEDYYDILERSQRGDLDITAWLVWFQQCLGRSIDAADQVSMIVLKKAKTWEWLGTKTLNDRQRLILNKILDETFEGKLNTEKWAKMMKCSSDTALRDITSLVDQGVLEKAEAGGRSTSYRLVSKVEDELLKSRTGDANKINVNEPWELEYWTKHFGVSDAKIREAVAAVGRYKQNVRAYLQQHKKL